MQPANIRGREIITCIEELNDKMFKLSVFSDLKGSYLTSEVTDVLEEKRRAYNFKFNDILEKYNMQPSYIYYMLDLLWYRLLILSNEIKCDSYLSDAVVINEIPASVFMKKNNWPSLFWLNYKQGCLDIAKRIVNGYERIEDNNLYNLDVFDMFYVNFQLVMAEKKVYNYEKIITRKFQNIESAKDFGFEIGYDFRFLRNGLIDEENLKEYNNLIDDYDSMLEHREFLYIVLDQNENLIESKGYLKPVYNQNKKLNDLRNFIK